MNRLRRVTIMLAITSALIGGTAATAHAAEGDGGVPGQTQGDDGAPGGVIPGTSGGENSGGTYSDGSEEGDYGDGGPGYGDDDNSTIGMVPESMWTEYMALGYYNGVYVYAPGVSVFIPTQDDLDAFNLAKGDTCGITADELKIACKY